MLSWPLETNRIRGEKANNAYGMVRLDNKGVKRAHQGWDLAAQPGTPCYTIADGVIRWASPYGDYGLMVTLEFQHHDRTLYATYAHLMSHYVYNGRQVRRGDMIGRTGQSGNAKGQQLGEAHLHFGIRTTELPQQGLTGHVDPAQLFGAVPINGVFIDRFDKNLKSLLQN